MKSSVTSEDNYQLFLKPKVAELLRAAGLDKVFHSAEGDYVYHFDEAGVEHKVVDFLGGYGVSLFGHNHPELVRVATEVLSQKRPFAAQASIRSRAGTLAKKLSDMLEQSTQHDFVATLANSGAEAVEAAIKHAVFEKEQKLKFIFAGQEEVFKELRLAHRNGLQIAEGLFQQAEVALGISAIKTLEDLKLNLISHNKRIFAESYSFLACKGSFHGKSSGALKLTSNKAFRHPWLNFGIEVIFVERNNINAIFHVLEKNTRHYWCLEFTKENGLELVKKPWLCIAGCFAEPIQGEGGIHELTPEFARALADVAQQHGFPLIMDEIQSGMGRTGRFLASEHLGVTADYYLFSKALGGNLAKISALMIKRKRYIEDFGYLHTSTFAEDDFSSSIALRSLELLEENDNALIKACVAKGDYLLAELNGLVLEYPCIFKALRGRGLMLGLELKPQLASKSSFIRLLSEQSLLAYLICGYLLNQHKIRVTPTLSEDSTIRIEPSAYISFEAMNALVLALRDVAEKLSAHDSHTLIAHLVNGDTPEQNQQKLPCSNPKTTQDPQMVTQSVNRVACVGHFMQPLDLVHWDSYLTPLSEKDCVELLEKTQMSLEPFLVDQQLIQSVRGDVVELSVIGVPYTAEQLISKVRTGRAKEACKIIQAAYDIAFQLGAKQVGFTGYSSIATNNCTAIVENQAGLTSGNSLTAALALDALHNALRDLDLKPEEICLAVVGGTGNIGQILTQLEAKSFKKIRLIGRAGSHRRLQRLAKTLYQDVIDSVKNQHTLTGIAKTLYENFANGVTLPPTADALMEQDDSVITLSTSMTDLKDCQAVISATNTPSSLIFPEHISRKSTVICDISVPADVHDSVENTRSNVKVIRGGRVRLPLGQSLQVRGMPIEKNELYACIAETLLLGFAGVSDSFSYGALEKEKVQTIRKLSHEHGFEVIS